MNDKFINRFDLISFTSSKVIVDSYHRIIASLKSQNVLVNHIGIASDFWYVGNAYSAYTSYGYEAFQLPRISGNQVSWWKEKNINNEYLQSLESIYLFFKEIIAKRCPNAFLFADDQGPIEKFIIRIFNDNHIPVVMLEHGHCVIVLNPQRPWLDRYSIENKTTSSIENTLNIYPEGFNGNYYICSYSGISTIALISNGIHSSRIKDTGYPLWDLIYQLREVNKEKNNNEKKKILFVSSGWGMFGDTYKEGGSNFYNFFISLCYILQDHYEIYLRLKPGENLLDTLNENLLSKINTLNFTYDDNSVSSYDTIQHYDLILGDHSTMLIEAMLLDVPVVLLRNPIKNVPGYITYTNFLTLLTLDEITNDSEKIISTIETALSDKYLVYQKEQLQKNEKYLFHILDGKAGYRVAQVLLEAIGAQEGKQPI